MIDLSFWNLTIPAGATVIPTKALNAGYTDQFFLRRTDGALTFIAPSTGENIKSTKNSTYPRSELRETLANGDDKEANWRPASAALHSLEATLSVEELPKSKKAIIGQIHGDGDHPPLKIQITGTTIYAQLRRKLDGVEDKPKLLTGYKLAETFTYRFEVDAQGRAKFFINGKQVVSDTLPADGYQFDMASYAMDTWYFKAGMYSQEKVGGTGTGRATFHALTAYHGPAAACAVPDVALPLATILADQIVDTFSAWQIGEITAKEAATALNALSKVVAKVPSDKDRAPLYAQIKYYKGMI